MTYNKWPSPNGHAIASDKTDKINPHPLADIGGTAIDALERALNQLGNKYWDGVKVNISYALDLLRAQPQVAGGDGRMGAGDTLVPYSMPVAGTSVKIPQPEAANVALDWFNEIISLDHVLGGLAVCEDDKPYIETIIAALQTPASDTPPQSPNRAVLDALHWIVTNGNFTEEQTNDLTEKMRIVEAAATQADKCIDTKPEKV